MTSKSLSEQLAEITNPVPTLHDPEDDIYEETRARVTERDAALSDGDGDGAPSQLRRRAAALVLDSDPRYAGRAVSRKSLLSGGSDGDDSADGSDDVSEADDVSEDSDDSEPDADSDGAAEQGEDDDDEDLEQFKAKLNGVATGVNGLSPEEDVETDSEEAVDQPEDCAGSEDSEEDGSEDAGSEEEQEEEDGEELGSEDGGVDLTSHAPGSDADRGAAVKAQLGIWDQLLECRIKLQPCVQLCNQLLAPDGWQPFWAAAPQPTADKLAEAGTAAAKLLKQLLELQGALLSQFPETRQLAAGPGPAPADAASDDSLSDSEAPAANPAGRKRRRPPPADPAKRFAAYRPYRDQTIGRWNDKTRLTAGRATGKSFAAFEQSTLKQIEQILSDRERLVKRTKLRRTDGAPLGRPQQTQPTAADEKKEYDDEIFDDSDFYHQLLRELIERKTVDVTDPLALGRQWIQIQKLRSKIKKQVDTRASKGRKVRYEVYPKLVNFMASQRAGTMSDSARDELFASLFGSKSRPAADMGNGIAWNNMNGEAGL